MPVREVDPLWQRVERALLNRIEYRERELLELHEDYIALEIRYNGNRSVHQWLSKNINEVNIFENGFLGQFKTAQQNLAVNQQRGIPRLQPRRSAQPFVFRVRRLAGRAFAADRGHSDRSSAAEKGEAHRGEF